MSEISERIFFHVTPSKSVPGIMRDGLLPFNKAKVSNINLGEKNLVYFGNNIDELARFYSAEAIVILKVFMTDTLLDEDLILRELFPSIAAAIKISLQKNRNINIHKLRAIITEKTIDSLGHVVHFKKIPFKVNDLIISMITSLFIEENSKPLSKRGLNFEAYINPNYTLYKILRITKGYLKEYTQMAMNKPIRFEGKNKIIGVIDKDKIVYMAKEARGTAGLKYFQRKCTHKDALFYALAECSNKNEFGYESLDNYEFKELNGVTVMRKLSLPERAKKYFSGLSAKLQQSIIRNSPEVGQLVF